MSFFCSKDNGKRYNTQNDHLRRKFGTKVIKLSLNAGMTCPNRDGTKGMGGCTYCSSSLSGDFSGCAKKTITEQLEEQVMLLSKKWSGCLYIPYFQAGSNTYAPTEKLKTLFEEAMSFRDTVGLAVATRADCISEETAEYLEDISKRTYLTVELGLQTIYDETALKINRCHTYEDFLASYKMLADRNINVCVHIINGLPGETPEMMLKTAGCVSLLRPHSVKIHMLHIIKDSALAAEYEKEPFPLLSKEEYTDIVCSQIELMHPETVIERITGDGNRSTLIAPMWTTDKKSVINGIDKELRRRNTYQGIHYTMLQNRV